MDDHPGDAPSVRPSGDQPKAAGRDPWKAVGELIRTQRQMARLSIRQLAELARVSNPYISQIERGLYKPSAQVLKSIAKALGIPVESLYERIGLIDTDEEAARSEPTGVEAAIRADDRLTTAQKEALLGVYRGFVGGS